MNSPSSENSKQTPEVNASVVEGSVNTSDNLCDDSHIETTTLNWSVVKLYPSYHMTMFPYLF